MDRDLKDYPLYTLFEAMQAYDLSLRRQALDINNYLLLLEQLQYGYCLLSREDLYALCKSMLLKPHHKEETFRKIFDDYLKGIAAVQEAEKTDQDDDKRTEDDKTETIPGQDPEINQKTEEDDPKDQEDQEEDPLARKTPSSEKKPGEKEYEKVSIRFQESTAAGQLPGMNADMKAIERRIYSQSFILKGKYFPLPQRRIQQNIRSLRDFTDLGVKSAIDLEATVDKVARKGYFDEPAYMIDTDITTPMNFFIDWGGSMVAFHYLAEAIAEAAQRSRKRESNHVFYFYNFPTDHVYRDKERSKPVPVTSFRNEEKNAFLVISDAGAARGRKSQERLTHTLNFLKKIRHQRLAWLNPVPRRRWKNSSAEDIAAMVPMFDISDEGFSRAMKLLKGKSR